MDIYAKKGTIVKFEGASLDSTRFGSCDDPTGILIEGNTYEVDYTDVHSMHTKVHLVGIEGGFNSVQFEDIENA